jgi:hypothetical protein
MRTEIVRNARNATRYSVRSKLNVPYGGRNPTLNNAELTTAATIPGPAPPSHELATTGTRNRNATGVCDRLVRNGSNTPATARDPRTATA